MDFYPASGACDDWMYDQVVVSPDPAAKINKGLVYTIELPPENNDEQVGAAITLIDEVLGFFGLDYPGLTLIWGIVLHVHVGCLTRPMCLRLFFARLLRTGILA